MTINELRQDKNYTDAIEKIRNYSKGFRFTIDFSKIPKAKANALKIVLRDAEKMGLLESVSIGLNLNGDITDETYIRK